MFWFSPKPEGVTTARRQNQTVNGPGQWTAEREVGNRSDTTDVKLHPSQGEEKHHKIISIGFSRVNIIRYTSCTHGNLTNSEQQTNPKILGALSAHVL